MTNKSTPPAYSSINQDLIWVYYDANSIDVTKIDYKYIGELWIDGTLVYTERVYPKPLGAWGVFNFSAEIRSYVNPVYNPTGAGILAQELGAGEFNTGSVVIKIREEYNGAVGSVVLTDTAVVYFNHYNGRVDGFTMLGSYADKPATTRDRVVELLFASGKYYITYFAESAAPFNVVIGAHTKTITPTTTNTLQIINISPGAINTDFAGAITSATESYTVTIAGEAFTVNIVCPGWYTNYMVHFLNKFGGFESMLFNKPRKRTTDIVRSSYQQLPYRIDGTGAVSVKNGYAMHEQETNYAVRFNEKINIKTDLLSDDNYQWLSQLVQSPLIYLEDNGTLYPISIVLDNYEYMEYILDGLNSLSLDIKFTTGYNTQFR